MSKYGKRAVGLLLTGALCAGLLAGCGGAPEAAVTPTAPSESGSASGRRVETLRLEGGTDWGVPNPYLHQSRGPGTAKMRLVYGSLLEKDETGDVPWLAERWSMDGNDYTFTLFADAQFQDGAPLTTADVAFTLDYYQEHPPVSNSLGVGDGYLVDHYTVVDEQTITITVKEANADTLSNLGSFVILPKHIWENVDDPNSYTGEGYLTGSGAYACTAYDGATGSYEFTAFDGWCNGEQAAEKIQFVPVSDPLLAFESGEIEGNLVKNSLYSVPAMVMNENNEYLQDIEVRKAIAHAVNWSAVGEIAWGSLQTSADSHWPASTSYYVSHEGYTYDPDLAVQILKDAGYDPSEMSFYYIAVSSNAQEMRVMEAVQGYLGDIGITVECASYELNTALPYYFAGENDLAILNSTNGLNDVWSIYSATYNGLFVDRGLSDPEYRALLEEGLNTVDPEARAEAYRKLDDWLYENYWFLPYCEIQEAWCHNDRIAEMKMASSNFGCLGDIKLA